MLTRRHIRIKIMQSVYALSNGNQNSLSEEVKFIKKSLTGVFDLYLINLSFFKALQQHASSQHEINNTKVRTKDAFAPLHQVIANNKSLRFIAENKKLNQFIDNKKLNQWDLEFDYVKKIYSKILESDIFKAHKDIENPSDAEDVSFVSSIFKNIIAPDDMLYRFFEDQNMTWIDDLPLVNTFLIKQLKRLDLNSESSLEFPDYNESQEDISFGIDLFEKVIVNEDELQKELDGKTPNWDSERIANLDSILIKLAIAELFYFSNIPPKVTLNEYLEIAKEYSTPKSNSFINGVLDNLVKEYEKSNRMNKQGRGLL
jgi:transcription antitermination protein NusB